MPTRPITQGQMFLLPPDLGDLVPATHTVRFVAAFIDALKPQDWQELGIDLEDNRLGAARYHPKLLLGVWLYGFMTRIRSTRRLERACREQVPLLWLTGCQQPDHNSLWRFYDAHRESMRLVFQRTVRTAIELDLVDLALQAVDGTKVQANAAKERTWNRPDLERLMSQVEDRIQEIEAQDEADDQNREVSLPTSLAQARELREQVARALEQTQTDQGAGRGNLTDPDAVLMRGRGGLLAGYNAQAMVTALKGESASGMLITAAEVTNAAHDQGQLLPLIDQSCENTGVDAGTILADGGYHSGENLSSCEAKGYRVLMPESQHKALRNAYHKAHFQYEAGTDTFVCPQGERLTLTTIKRRKNRAETRVYGGRAQVCRECPAFGQCTRNSRQGRTIEVGPHERRLQAHRALMAEAATQALFRKRKQLVEPVFGIMKETQDARRFLTRGLEKVRAEWFLLAAAFNLRTLCRLWAQGHLADLSCARGSGKL